MASLPGLREGLVLVVGAAGRELGRGDVEDPPAGPLGDHVHEPQQVLVRVAEPHAAPDARFERRGRARQVERDHALVGVPHVDHAVDVLGRRGDLQRAEQVVPVAAQAPEGGVDLVDPEVAVDDTAHAPLVDRLGPGRVELRVGRVLRVAEHEHDLADLTGAQAQLDVVRAARRPAVGEGVARPPRLDRQRALPPPVGAEEGVPLRVEPRQRRRAGEVGEVVAALPVLGAVIDDTAVDLDLADRQVALEVGGVVPGVPQAELHGAEQREDGRPRRAGW